MFVANNDLLFGGEYLNEYSMKGAITVKHLKTAIDVLDITGAHSISIWVKMISIGGINMMICKDQVGGTRRSWLIYFRDTNYKLHWVFWNTDGSPNTLISSTANLINDGNWHNIVVTYSGTASANGMKMYIDGSLDVQMTSASSGVRNFTGSGSWIPVGASGAVTPAWMANAYFDETGIWNGTELTAANVTNDIWNGGTPKSLVPLSPTIYWRMGEGATWDGVDWTIPEEISGVVNTVSQGMVEADRTTEVP